MELELTTCETLFLSDLTFWGFAEIPFPVVIALSLNLLNFGDLFRREDDIRACLFFLHELEKYFFELLNGDRSLEIRIDIRYPAAYRLNSLGLELICLNIESFLNDG